MGRRKKLRIKPSKPPKELPELNIPQYQYKRILEKLENPDPYDFIQNQHYDSKLPVGMQKNCFNKSKVIYEIYSKDGIQCSANYQKAAQQALEARDFKGLYKIIIRGFELKDTTLSKILYECLYLAIENDPMIKEENREQMLLDAVRGCKLMYESKGKKIVEFDKEQDALQYIREAHMLLRNNDIEDKSEEDDESE